MKQLNIKTVRDQLIQQLNSLEDNVYFLNKYTKGDFTKMLDADFSQPQVKLELTEETIEYATKFIRLLESDELTNTSAEFITIFLVGQYLGMNRAYQIIQSEDGK